MRTTLALILAGLALLGVACHELRGVDATLQTGVSHAHPGV